MTVSFCYDDFQRDLRAMDARMVAEKSTKIRDWVARKIHQVRGSLFLIMINDYSSTVMD